MKIILTQHIKGVGDTHDMVTVSDGYGLNFLIRTGKAISATSSHQHVANMRKEKLLTDKKIQEKLLEQNIATLFKAHITIAVLVNEKGHLYEAVGISEILSAVSEQVNVSLPKEMIKLEHPIKEIGTYDVPITYGKLFGKFSIIIKQQK